MMSGMTGAGLFSLQIVFKSDLRRCFKIEFSTFLVDGSGATFEVILLGVAGQVC